MKNQPSLPKEFEEALRRKIGDSFHDFLTSLQQVPPVSLRVNPEKPFQIKGEQVAWSKFGRYLPDRPVFTLDPSFHAGSYYVQEASSMFLEQAIHQAVDTSKPLRVLDLCAAPGGKSTHLLSLLSHDSLLVTNEAIRSRAYILSENIQKWGHSNVVVTNNDPEDFTSLEGFFDVIVVDAPCSGEGLFRKDAEAIQEWSPANVDLCSKRQRRIVSDIWPSLKNNGVLIYCTCTYNEQENEENIAWLKKQHHVEPVPLKIDSSWGIETTEQNGITGYRFYPHKVRGEGFFLTVIRKTIPQQESRIKSKNRLEKPLKKITEQLNEWFVNNKDEFFSWMETVYAVPVKYWNEIEFLSQRLKIVHAGTPTATIKHEKIIPEHGAALSIKLKKEQFSQLEVNLEDALQYLRKEPIETGSVKRGYTLVTYKQLPLGWLNVLDNRSNNLYPKEWRIRMAG